MHLSFLASVYICSAVEESPSELLRFVLNFPLLFNLMEASSLEPSFLASRTPLRTIFIHMSSLLRLKADFSAVKVVERLLHRSQGSGEEGRALQAGLIMGTHPPFFPDLFRLVSL